MSALGKVVRSGVRRRLVQTTVMALVTLAATASVVLGATLLVASHAPFERAFKQQDGAHLTALFDAGKVGEPELAATADTDGVTGAAGPFATAVINPETADGMRMPAMTVAGRSTPDDEVDDITITEGRWASGPGEIVMSDRSGAGGEGMPSPVGTTVEFPDLPGAPELKIVGLARTVSETADAWVVPEQVDELLREGEPGGWQMLYRFDEAQTKSQLDDARDAVTAGLDDAALTGSRSWLAVRKSNTAEASLLVPFLVTFGVLGVAMAVLIVGNIVTGSVGTSVKRIGVLKAVGFTPGQVVRAFMARALIPAALGAGLGVAAGNLLARPVLAETNWLYGTSDSGVVWWVDALAFAGILGVVTATAWIAALRAGRLRTVDALAVGRGDRAARGRWAARLAAVLPVPRSVSLGLAQPFARPGRAAAIIAAIAFGAAAVTFAAGLAASLGQIQATQRHGDVAVYPSGPPTDDNGGRPPAIDVDAVAAAISGQDGAKGYSGLAQTEVAVAGITGSVEAYGLTGTATSHGYRMVDGEWFDGPDEIVVATPFLTATETKLGDTVRLTSNGEKLTVRIVGEVFNTESRGMQVLTDLETLAAADEKLTASEFNVVLEPGTDPDDFAAALNGELKPLETRAVVHDNETEDYVLIINSLTALLTLLLIAVAAMGVLNTVVLETRERVRDIGVHKALGMVPRQTVAMVLASVVVTGLVGGVLGVPIGMYLQRTIVAEMGAGAGFSLPAAMLDVYTAGDLAVFALGGLAIAIAGALLPAGWAAKTRTATALRAE